MQNLKMDSRPPPHPEVWHDKCSLLLRRALQGVARGERKEEGPTLKRYGGGQILRPSPAIDVKPHEDRNSVCLVDCRLPGIQPIP